MTAARSSQVVVETLESADPAARATQVTAEALVRQTPTARASQVALEALVRKTAIARASQVVVEVLLSLAGLTLEIPVLPVYPLAFALLPGLTYNVNWAPEFFNMPSAIAASGASIDVALASAPLHTFELKYNFFRDYLAPSEFKQMMGFWLRLGGTVGRFLFLNPDDNKVVGQAVATTDGVLSTFGPIPRTFGVGANSGTEPVGALDLTATVNVYLNGVLQDPATYQLLTSAPCNQQVKFLSTPGAGLAISMDFSFFYYCRFADNQATFEKFMDKLWQLSKVSIQSCRAGA